MVQVRQASIRANPKEVSCMADPETHLTSSSSSTKASRRVGPPVPSRNLGAPRTMVVLRGGMVSSFAAYSISITSFGCRNTWQPREDATAGSTDGVSTPITNTWKKNKNYVKLKRNDFRRLQMYFYHVKSREE